MKQPWLYQNDACPFMHGAPGWVALTQPSPLALAEHPSVFASQLTSCASTALREVGYVMHPCPAAATKQHAAAARRANMSANGDRTGSERAPGTERGERGPASPAASSGQWNRRWPIDGESGVGNRPPHAKCLPCRPFDPCHAPWPTAARTFTCAGLSKIPYDFGKFTALPTGSKT
jgi:hypothetical protein